MKNRRLQGFTLVEMAIVLVIIGTIVGTIMIAQNIIVTSRLQTVVTDANAYIAAAVNFKQTYQALPGDFPTAASMWGTDSNGCTTGGGTSGTCNGNGSGLISNPILVPASSSVGETFLFWQHLNLAGMTTQAVTNAPGSGGSYDSIIGVNVPVGSIKGSGFSVYGVGTASSDPNLFNGVFYGNALFFGASHAIVSGAIDYSYTRDGILTPDQAQSIDTKIDDGAPATGKILSFAPGSTATPNCTVLTSSVYYYNVGTSNLCSLVFVTGF